MTSSGEDRARIRCDRVQYQFRRSDPSGRRSWVTDGSSWCRRLATLIPPRRSHGFTACCEQVTQCPRCGDHLRVLAFITDLQVTGHILEHLGLSSDRVPIAPARAPPRSPRPRR